MVCEGSNLESEKRLFLVRFCIPPTRKEGAIPTSFSRSVVGPVCLRLRPLIGFVGPVIQ